jgi:hypothetical protein
MKVFIKILIISIFVISCRNTNNQDENKIITFDLKELPKTTTVKLSDLGFVDVEYIPLETNEQSLISGIGDIFHSNSVIITGDGYFLLKHYKIILKFQGDGSFVSRIGTVGRGPNELTYVDDVNIDKESHNIYIVSGGQKKFNVYSENGEFIRTFPITLYALINFRFIDGNILCYCENHMGRIENSFTLMDTNGVIIKNYPNMFPFKKLSAYGFANENLFYQFNNQLFKKEVYSDTIYLFENMTFKPHLVIEVGDRLITPEARSKYEALYLAENYINPLNLFEFGDYVYYEFIYKFVPYGEELAYGFIGSKKNNFQALFNLEQGIINDLDGGPNIWPKTTKDDITLIGCIDALKLKTHVASESFKNSTPKYPEKKKELEKLAVSLKETDNPVLMLVRLKE